ncbi:MULTISPECIES: maleylacetoacetate isomerase [Gemmobacter]|jgi:maleylacetoacetate isomerase|uniref:maleylacetoacetate isomerase n=1 Tax=Gemmobacter TaxID=204456 RepID=UPI0006C75A5A|nr:MULTISPECIES: maleylacetoacetate isomerase [Gemmobacter]TWI89782.1 maleylacetoacetate isomerase [Gemmobacter caeni]
MIRLFDYWRSSASYRLRIALGLAGLSWHSLPVDLTTGQQCDPEHLARNPQGLVPVLEIDDLTLTQSLAIIEYLDETRGLGLLPGPAANRARIRAVAHAIAMDIHPVCNLRVARYAVAQSNGGITMETWMRDMITPGLIALENMVDTGNHCIGQTLTLADICLVPQIYNARRWNIDLKNLPNLNRITTFLENLKPFANAHPNLAKL